MVAVDQRLVVLIALIFYLIRLSKVILETLEKELGIKAGETTPDGMFTLIEVECLGACVNAPMLQLGDDYFEDLTPETTKQLIDKLKKNEPVTPGPQCGKRKNSAGPQGKTSLFEAPWGPSAPNLDKPIEKKQ